MEIKSVFDTEFARYGQIHEGYELDGLLDAYASFMEDQATGNERDLTEQETAEITRQCDLLQAKCMVK